MAYVLLRLRLAIRWHRWGGTATGRLVAWLLWGTALVLGLAGGALVAFLDGTANGRMFVLAIFGALFFGWVALPVIIPALADQTVDPTRLEMYPLTAWEKVSGLGLGAMVAPTALFTFLVASGGAFASGLGVMTRFLVPVVAVLFVMLCVAGSRAVQALIAHTVSTRKGRDIMLVATGVVSVGFYVALQVGTREIARLSPGTLGVAGDVLALTPPGAAGEVTLLMRAGDPAGAALFLIYLCAATGLFAVLWGWAISRHEARSAGVSRRKKQTTASADRLVLTGGLLSVVPPTATLASAAQYFHLMFFRAPKLAQQLVIGLVFGVLFSHGLGVSSGLLVGSTLFGVYLSTGSSSGMFNYDARGFGYLAEAGIPMRPVVVGRVAAHLVVGAVAIVLFVTVEAAFGGLWTDLMPAVLVGWASVLWGVTVGAVVSALAPFDQEAKQGTGRGRSVVAILAGFVVVGVGVAVVMVVTSLANLGPWPTAGISVAAGLAVAFVGVRRAVRVVDRDPLRMAQALGV